MTHRPARGAESVGKLRPTLPALKGKAERWPALGTMLGSLEPFGRWGSDNRLV